MPAASAEKRARQRANKLKLSASTAQAPEIDIDSTPILPTSTPPIPPSQPASTSQGDVHTPAATQLTFSNFIVSATAEDIKKFLNLAATTQEGVNLQYLWRWAYNLW
jgi:hypothetical protein